VSWDVGHLDDLVGHVARRVLLPETAADLAADPFIELAAVGQLDEHRRHRVFRCGNCTSTLGKTGTARGPHRRGGRLMETAS
jgi:hypothetical protein